MDLETSERVGYWERGRRAKQFKATSSGREGMSLRSDGGDGSGSEEQVEKGDDDEVDCMRSHLGLSCTCDRQLNL